MKRFLALIMLFAMSMATVAMAQDDYSDILNIPEAKSQKEAGEILKAWHDRVLERIKAAPADIVVRIVKDKSLSPGYRKMVLEIMRNPQVRSYANNPEVIAALKEILNDKKDTKIINFGSEGTNIGDQEFVRGEVVDTLAAIGGDSVINTLIDTLNTDESAYVRGLAASNLGRSEKAVPHLINALSTFESKIGSDRITYYEGQAISRMIDALGRSGDEEAANTIIKLFKNKRDVLKNKVPNFVTLNIPFYSTMGDMGSRASEAVPVLLEELRTVRAQDRGILIDSIGKIGDRRAVDTLINELGGRDSYDRMRAAEALGRIGDPKAATPVTELLNRMDKEGRRDDDYAYKKVKDSYKKLTGQEYRKGQ